VGSRSQGRNQAELGERGNGEATSAHSDDSKLVLPVCDPLFKIRTMLAQLDADSKAERLIASQNSEFRSRVEGKVGSKWRGGYFQLTSLDLRPSIRPITWVTQHMELPKRLVQSVTDLWEST
jgi:hypothetical protein